MLYMAKTAYLQEDDSVRCEGLSEADAEAKPWALLALTRAADDDPGWRLVGTYASESAALAARRRLSRRLDTASGDPQFRYERTARRRRARSTDVDQDADLQSI
jgi:hypothetical protein